MDRSKGWRRAIIPVVSMAALAVLTVWMTWSTLQNDDKPLTTLSPVGEEGRDIQSLVKPVFIVAGVVFVVVQAAVIYLIVRFRQRDDENELDPAEEPVQVHGNNRLEIAWTIAPAVLLAALAFPNFTTIFELEERDADAMQVEVIGQQWWWEFRYDIFDEDGEEGSDGVPDIITANLLTIPQGRQVDLTIESNDVIHSFWIPALNGKRDAVPGRTHTLSLQSEELGLFRGQCTEYCGLSHALMRMQVEVVSTGDFNTWVQGQLEPPTEPEPESLEAEGQEIFVQQCARCHQINGLSDQLDGTLEDGPVRPDPDYEFESGDTSAPPALLSGNAPNLTHLMSRYTFAGSILDLYQPEGDHYDTSEPYVNDLESWIRRPSDHKPMDAEGLRGMPDLGLSEEQIDALVAYLTTLD